MSKMSKTLVLIAPMCAALLLSGCGPKGTGGGAGGVTDATTITLSTTAGKSNQEALNRFINGFKKIEPNITVELDIVSGNYAQIASDTISGFTTGDYGDLVMVYPDDVDDFIDYGRAVKLDDYINSTEYGWSSEDKEDYIETFLSEGQKFTTEGTYSLPMSKSTEVVYYNKNKVLNLTLPGVNNGNPINEVYLNSLTWEEFFNVLCPAIVAYTETEAGSKLIDKTGSYWSVMSYDSDDNLFITLAEQYGYDYTAIENGKGKALFNNSDMKQLMYTWNSYAKLNYINTAGSTGARSNSFFTAGQTLFSVGSTAGSYKQYADGLDVGVFKLPHPEGKARKVILQGPSVAILKHKNANNEWDKTRIEAAWKFYKFMTNSYNALDWALTTNYMPIRQSCYETEDYKRAYDVSIQEPKTLDILNARIGTLVKDFADDFYTSPAFKGSNECRTQVGGIVTTSLTKTKTQADIDAAFEKALTNANIAIGN